MPELNVNWDILVDQREFRGDVQGMISRYKFALQKLEEEDQCQPVLDKAAMLDRLQCIQDCELLLDKLQNLLATLDRTIQHLTAASKGGI